MFNSCFVGKLGDKSIVMLNPPKPGEAMTREQVAELCAWLIVMADLKDDDLLELTIKLVEGGT